MSVTGNVHFFIFLSLHNLFVTSKPHVLGENQTLPQNSTTSPLGHVMFLILKQLSFSRRFEFCVLKRDEIRIKFYQEY